MNIKLDGIPYGTESIILGEINTDVMNASQLKDALQISFVYQGRNVHIALIIEEARTLKRLLDVVLDEYDNR